MPITRRTFLAAAAAPSSPAPHEPHFPDMLHQFVFRNWELVNIDAIARVAGAPPARILEIGQSMGLPPKPRLTAAQGRRIYITVIRQNWRTLPNDQIVELLGWTPEKFEFTLKEDDFLDVKLGAKPELPRLRYAPPSAAARRRAAEIAGTLRDELGAAWNTSGEPPFAFIDRISSPQKVRELPRGDLRLIYSCFALYGDPLLEPDIDPFPDGYLARLANLGINAVWMQAVLRTLAPAREFPEFGARSDERLAALRRLVDRAARSGIKLYLYLNEPRAMPPDFFAKRPDIRGAESRGLYAMCTSVPRVRAWIEESVAHVFRRVPGLGGVFTITMSENFTNCHSRMHPEACPRCSRRQDSDVVGEVIQSIRAGVRRASPDAGVIAWDWGWPEPMSERLIPKLPKDVRLQSVSEWDAPVDRGGVHTRVGEYSISVVGPGPRATRHWDLARKAGVGTMAKVQMNNTWEISAVPYIPAEHLVARHCSNLSRAGVKPWMLSWTLGGFPSPNLAIAREFSRDPAADPAGVVARVAAARYGDSAAPRVVAAWKAFSDAFEEFPYGVAVYVIPTQHGPANLLRPQPSGIKSSMILFPQDDYKAWAGRYPAAVARDQFAKVAAGWQRGLESLRSALGGRPDAAEDLAIAETCYTHFRSTANQFSFYLEREAGRIDRALVKDELDLARRQFSLARRFSVLAYEASNHYYYRPLDLAEKILNCRALT